MRRVRVILASVLLFSCWSCKSDLQKKLEKEVATFEQVGINDLLHIEFYTRNNTEHYDYYNQEKLIASWEFNNDSAKFVNAELNQFKSVAANPEVFMQHIREKIKQLHLVLITQSNWRTEVVKFWISDYEYYSYLHSDFKFDDGSKILLENDLKNSIKINDNWYYKKLKVCKNK